jgi:type I restriction enzyme S subunit
VTPTKPSGLGWADEVPAYWDVAKICLVARLESGHTPSRLHPEYWEPDDCTIPWFALSDVWQLREGVQEYLDDTKEKISPRGMANSAARLLPAGTVVLSRTASVGFSGIMSKPMATTQDFANWVCGPRLQPEYLLYALRAMEDEFQRMTMGSTHQTIYMPDIRRLSIPVPRLLL